MEKTILLWCWWQQNVANQLLPRVPKDLWKKKKKQEEEEEEKKNEKGNRLLNRKFSGRGWVWASPLKLRRLVELSSPWPNGEKAFSIWTFRGFLAFFIFFSRAKAIGAETKLIKEKRRTRSPSCLLPVQCAQWLPASQPACLQNISLLLKNHF